MSGTNARKNVAGLSVEVLVVFLLSVHSLLLLFGYYRVSYPALFVVQTVDV